MHLLVNVLYKKNSPYDMFCGWDMIDFLIAMEYRTINNGGNNSLAMTMGLPKNKRLGLI